MLPVFYRVVVGESLPEGKAVNRNSNEVKDYPCGHPGEEHSLPLHEKVLKYSEVSVCQVNLSNKEYNVTGAEEQRRNLER